MLDFLWPNGLKHARLPCPSPSLRVCSNYVHCVDDAIQPSHSLSSFSSCFQSFPASVRIGNRSPKWRWLKDKEGKSPQHRTREGQGKVWWREWRLQVEQTALLASPVCIGQAQGEENTYKRSCHNALPPALLWVRSFSFSLSLQRAGVLLHSLLFMSLGWHALTLRGWILLLSFKWNTAETMICLRALTRFV